MKRRMFQLVLLLHVGAIVNVAVAWACARNSHIQFTELVGADDLGWWHQTAPAEFHEIPINVGRYCGFGREYSMYPPYGPENPGYDVRRERAGWPALALETSHWFDDQHNVSAR